VQWFRGISPTGVRVLAVLAAFLVVGHYADVTSQALFGRPVNLYWDSRHLTNVGAMFALVAHPWFTLLAVVGLIVIPLLTYLPLRWALGAVGGDEHPLAGERVEAAMWVIETHGELPKISFFGDILLSCPGFTS